MELKIPVKVEYTNVVVEMCKTHPTCDECPFLEKYKGCYFRGKIPREWEFPKEFEFIQANPLNKMLQAREEIQGNYEGGNHADEYVDGYNDGLLECLSILDRLIESEGVNGKKKYITQK